MRASHLRIDVVRADIVVFAGEGSIDRRALAGAAWPSASGVGIPGRAESGRGVSAAARGGDDEKAREREAEDVRGDANHRFAFFTRVGDWSGGVWEVLGKSRRVGERQEAERRGVRAGARG